jgi:hypothetical protein
VVRSAKPTFSFDMKALEISSPIATKNFVKRFRRIAGTAAVDARSSSAHQAKDKSLIRSSYRRVLSSQLTISATIIGDYWLGFTKLTVHQRTMRHERGT